MFLQSNTSREHSYFVGGKYAQTEKSYIAARGRVYDIRAQLYAEPLASSTRVPTSLHVALLAFQE